jgi:hypothetical protein
VSGLAIDHRQEFFAARLLALLAQVQQPLLAVITAAQTAAVSQATINDGIRASHVCRLRTGQPAGQMTNVSRCTDATSGNAVLELLPHISVANDPGPKRGVNDARADAVDGDIEWG